MSGYMVQPLGPDTWDAFEQLAKRHNGVWNGCWCTWFHTLYAEQDKERTSEGNRAVKERPGSQGRAPAAQGSDADAARGPEPRRTHASTGRHPIRRGGRWVPGDAAPL